MNLIKKPTLVALLVALVVLFCVSALLFLPKETTQFPAFTGNLWTVQEIGNENDWFRSSGFRGDLGQFREWNHTTYGLFFHWHVTDVSVDNPREFYRFIDRFAILAYAVFALGSAYISWVVTFMIVRLRIIDNLREKSQKPEKPKERTIQ